MKDSSRTISRFFKPRTLCNRTSFSIAAFFVIVLAIPLFFNFHAAQTQNLSSPENSSPQELLEVAQVQHPGKDCPQREEVKKAEPILKADWQKDLFNRFKMGSVRPNSKAESMDWAAFAASYTSRHGRPPAAGMDKWFSYALNHKCSLRHHEYDGIYKDLSRFHIGKPQFQTQGETVEIPLDSQKYPQGQQGNPNRPPDQRQGPAITPEMIKFAGTLPYTTWVRVANGQLEYVTGENNWFKNRTRTQMSMITEGYLADLPDVEFSLNENDEPLVLSKDPNPQNKAGTCREAPSPSPLPYDGMFYRSEWCHYEKLFSENTTTGATAKILRDVCDPGFVENATKLFDMHSFFISAFKFLATTQKVPVFSSSTVRSCFADIVIPAFSWFEPSTLKSPKEAPEFKFLKFSDRKDVLYWRGMLSGGTMGSWEQFVRGHRARLFYHFGSKTSPFRSPDVDVGVTAFLGARYEPLVQYSEVEPFSESMTYKYLLDVDGHTFSQRMLPFLRDGGVTLRMHVFEDWVMDRVEAYEHYVPIDVDYSDLLPKFRWLQSQPEVAESIVERAHRYAAENLRLEDMRCYFYRLLLEYKHLTMHPY